MNQANEAGQCIECGRADAWLRSRWMRKGIRYCVVCSWRRGVDLRNLLAIVVVPIILFSGGDALRILSVPVALAVALVVHEGGHALCAAAVGFPVTHVQLGHGRPLVQASVGGATVVIARRFIGGYATYHPVERTGLRVRMAAVVLAGAAANTLTALAAAALAPEFLRSSLVAMNLWFVVWALVPFDRRRLIDGRVLIRLLTAPRWELDAHFLEPYLAAQEGHRIDGDAEQALGASEAGLEHQPDSPHALNHKALALIDVGKADEARPILLGILDMPRIKRIRRLVLNNLAYADLVIGDPSLFPEAERASAEALAGSEVAAFLDTRAWALIETCQVAAGAQLAHRALNGSTGTDRARTQCVLALAAARSGDTGRAETFLAAARGVLRDDDPVFARISAAVAAASPLPQHADPSIDAA